jgi:hypothetical protein
MAAGAVATTLDNGAAELVRPESVASCAEDFSPAFRARRPGAAARWAELRAAPPNAT